MKEIWCMSMTTVCYERLSSERQYWQKNVCDLIIQIEIVSDG